MVRLRVMGMTCAHCERAVSEALERVSGVERVVSVSHERDEATIEGTPDMDLLIAAVEEEGYEVEAAG